MVKNDFISLVTVKMYTLYSSSYLSFLVLLACLHGHSGKTLKHTKKDRTLKNIHLLHLSPNHNVSVYRNSPW